MFIRRSDFLARLGRYLMITLIVCSAALSEQANASPKLAAGGERQSNHSDMYAETQHNKFSLRLYTLIGRTEKKVLT